MTFEKDSSIQDVETSRKTSHVDETTLNMDDVERQTRDRRDEDGKEGKEESDDPNIVNWHKDDPENPLNWRSSKKIGVVSVVAFITMLS